MSEGASRFKYGPDDDRQCPRCERDLPAENFHAKTRFDDGSVRTRQTLCADCTRERQRELRGHKPQTRQSKAERRRRRKAAYERMMSDPARVAKLRAAKREQAQRRRDRAKTDPTVDAAIRATTKRYYEKRKADPEVMLDKLIDARIRYRDQADPRFAHSDAAEAFVDIHDYVPIEPFLDWLAVTFDGDVPGEFVELVGHDMKRFRDRDAISLGIVDRIVTHGLGRPDLVESLYPYDTYRAGFTRSDFRRRFANV
jgi:flagellar biosynthesis GTPase FlhF